MINYWRHHWYYIGGIIFVLLAFFLAFFNGSVSRIQVILLCSFMAMLVHQFEEYALPGGFPSMANFVMFRDRGIIDRYPLNANQCFICNVFFTYAFYLIPVFLPGVIWLGLAQVMAGFLQIPAHGIMLNRRLKSIYNPGLGATMFLQLPIGIYYIWYTYVNGLAAGGSYVTGFIAAVAGMMLVFGLPILIMHDKNTGYPFEEREVYGFAEDKIRKMEEENRRA